MKTRKALDRLAGRPAQRQPELRLQRDAGAVSGEDDRAFPDCSSRRDHPRQSYLYASALLHELTQQGRRIAVAILDESDELLALLLAESDEQFPQCAAGLDLEAAPIVRRLLEQFVDRRLVGLLLGEFLPR